MENATTLTDRNIRSLVGGAALLALGSYAAAQPAFAEYLGNRGVAPLPVARHVATHRVLVANGGEVRAASASPVDRSRDGELVHSSGRETVLRIRVDAPRERLWVLDTRAVHVVDLATRRRVRSIVLPNWMHVDEPTNCLPDLQLDRAGAAFVSDNIQPKLWRIDARDFSVSERTIALATHGKLDVGFSALAVTDAGELFAAMAAPGLLWRIDTASYRAQSIALETPIRGACAIEAAKAREPQGLALYVLGGRERFELKRVTLRPGAATASVEAAPMNAAPPGLLAQSGATSPLTASRTRRTQPGHFALRAIYYGAN